MNHLHELGIRIAPEEVDDLGLVGRELEDVAVEVRDELVDAERLVGQ